LEWCSVRQFSRAFRSCLEELADRRQSPLTCQQLVDQTLRRPKQVYVIDQTKGAVDRSAQRAVHRFAEHLRPRVITRRGTRRSGSRALAARRHAPTRSGNRRIVTEWCRCGWPFASAPSRIDRNAVHQAFPDIFQSATTVGVTELITRRRSHLELE
jgi:hypothetical protein